MVSVLIVRRLTVSDIPNALVDSPCWPSLMGLCNLSDESSPCAPRSGPSMFNSMLAACRISSLLCNGTTVC